jgi:hypothetical protein
MTKGRALHLVSVLACLGLLAGCGERASTPTSPEPPASVAAADEAAPPASAGQPAAAWATGGPGMRQPQDGSPVAVADASRGGGLPRMRPDGSTPERRGGAPPRGGSDGGAPGAVELSLAVQPDVWSLDDAHGSRTVTALITGSGLAAIDLRSIVLVGSSKSAAPLAPRSVQRTGSEVQAVFSEAGAIATLDAPIAGERERIDVRVKAGGATQSLSAYLHVVGSSPY